MNKLIYYDEQKSFLPSLVGKTIIEIRGARANSDHISFRFSDGSAMKMFHMQSCCEHVAVDDICGDIDDLLNTPLLGAEISYSNNRSNEYGPADEFDSSYTWTFYKFKTYKGYVDIKWYGTSNGYYSESVDIEYYEPHKEDWESVFEY